MKDVEIPKVDANVEDFIVKEINSARQADFRLLVEAKNDIKEIKGHLKDISQGQQKHFLDDDRRFSNLEKSGEENRELIKHIEKDSKESRKLFKEEMMSEVRAITEMVSPLVKKYQEKKKVIDAVDVLEDKAKEWGENWGKPLVKVIKAVGGALIFLWACYSAYIGLTK